MTISPNKWELDVQGYLNVCNVTSATPRKQLRDFAYGVDELGLWNSMVCWPLRSSQNIGGGDTVFSFGGLGTFNGTRVNGPTWGSDGVTFNNASAQYISTDCIFDSSTLSTGFLTIINQTESPNFSNLREICGNRNGTAAAILFKSTTGTQDIALFDSVGDHNSVSAASRIAYTAGRQFAGGFVNSATRQFFNQLNSTTATATSSAGTITSASNKFQIARAGEYGTTRTFTGEIAFVGLIRQATITAENIEACRSLLTQTLGSGLELP